MNSLADAAKAAGKSKAARRRVAAVSVKVRRHEV
jgi:hypothetical protein